MAYKTSELEKQAKEAIKKYKLIFIEEVVSFMSCSKPTFYEHKLNESDTLKSLIQKNKDEMKAALRAKWYNSDNPTVQMALMKLICTDNERKMLSMSHTDITSGGEALQQLPPIIIKAKQTKE